MSVQRKKGYDELEQQPLTGDDKKEVQYIRENYRLTEQDNFIRKSYLLCVLLFFATGVTMVTAVLEGVYSDFILAEEIMTTLFGTIYMVLFVTMLCCYSSTTLRIALLLFISVFIGCVAGFMISAHLKVVVQHLNPTSGDVN